MTDEQASPETRAAGGEATRAGGSVRILFVTPDGRRTDAVAALDDRNLFIVEAMCAGDARERLATGDVECLLCEHPLPESDALDVLGATGGLPSVLVATESTPGLADDALAAGAADVVRRHPGDSGALLSRRVRDAVGNREPASDSHARQEDELRRVYHALETAQEGIALLDDDGEFVYVNEAYADLHGTDTSTMLGRSWMSKYTENEAERVQEEVLPTVADEGTWSGRTLGRREDGSTFRENHSLSATADGGLVCTIRDVTAKEEREALVDRYRSVVEDVFGESELGVFILDDADEVAWSNTAAEDYFDLDGERVAGRTFADVAVDEFADALADPGAFERRVVEASQNGDRVRDGEVHVTGSDTRRERHLQHRSQPIESGEYGGGRVEIFYDVTERRHREELVRDAKQRQRAILDGTYEFIGLVEPDGTLVDANSASLEWDGASRADLEEPFWESGWFTHTDGVTSQVRDAVGRAADGEFVRTELPLEDASGEETVFDFSLHPVEDDSGDVVYLVPEGRDITDRKRAEERLTETIGELERSNERLEQFASVASHDLRNPLGVARMFVEEARENEEDYLDEIERALERMDDIVQDVLNVARAGKDVERTESVALDDVSTQAWDQVETSEASLHVAEDVTVVEAESNRLQGAFENVFRNAIEHGGRSVDVRVGGLPDGFFVEDDGPGIDPDRRNAVFDFGESYDDGTGFGLAIVEEVASAHGWQVSVGESASGGARFEVRGVDTTAN